MDTDSHVLKWFAGIGAIVTSAAIIGTFTSLLQIEKTMVEMKTKQGNIVISINAINADTGKIEDRLRSLEKGE